MNKLAMGELEPITLPAPVFNHCVTVFEALKSRRTSRLISGKKISLQILSDILWAAQGVNRVEGPFGRPGRTAGSASNSQELCIYIAREEGVYLYEPDSHKMNPVVTGDSRALAITHGQAETSENAPIRFIYVVDMERFTHAGYQEPGLYNPQVRKSYYYVDTGLIAQNVYLASASLGLSSWFHNCNKNRLTKILGLKPLQRPLFGQTIGYPEN